MVWINAETNTRKSFETKKYLFENTSLEVAVLIVKSDYQTVKKTLRLRQRYVKR